MRGVFKNMGYNSKKISYGYCGSTESEELISNDYLQINNCGLLRWDDYASPTIDRRQRLDYMLIYVSEGKGKFYTDDQIHTLNAGDLIYYPPNTSITFTFEPYSQHYWIHFTGSSVEQLIKTTGIKYGVINHIGVINDINLIFSEIAFSISKKSETEKLFINSNFLKLLYIISNQLNNQKSFSPSNENHPVHIAKNLMLVEFWKDHDADYYAKKSGCSISTFNHAFQKIYKTSPKKFITTLRMEHAKRLLITSNLSIKDVSSSSGYNDSLYFCKTFKSYSNMTPKEYRNKYQER